MTVPPWRSPQVRGWRVTQQQVIAGLILAGLILGVLFRVVALDQRVYWHDEAYSSLRSAGYTAADVTDRLFIQKPVAIADLQTFQHRKPNSTLADTLHSLIQEDPQHPPLYFLLLRGWMQTVGESVVAVRSLAVIFGILAIPAMYALAREVCTWGAPLPGILWPRFTAGVAALWVALSPVEVQFSRINRQYSLLILLIIASSWLLLRALRHSGSPGSSSASSRPPSSASSRASLSASSRASLSTRVSARVSAPWLNWCAYGVVSALGLYTQLFFGLVIVAQVGFGLCQWRRRSLDRSQILGWLGAAAIACVLYLPWLWVLNTQWQAAMNITAWTSGFRPLDIVQQSAVSLSALFLDLDFGATLPMLLGWRLPVLVILAIAAMRVVRLAPPAVRDFLVLLAVGPFLVMLLVDIVSDRSYTSVARYLLICDPGWELLVAFGLTWVSRRRWGDRPRWAPWQVGTIALLMSWAIASNGVSGRSPVWWSSDVSRTNDQAIAAVNARAQPVVISDFGPDYTNFGNLLALSWDWRSETRLILTLPPPGLPDLRSLPNASEVLVFRPTADLTALLEQQGTLIPDRPEAGVWAWTPPT